MNKRMVAGLLAVGLLQVPSVWADPLGENPGPVESAVTDGSPNSEDLQVAQAQLVEQARADLLTLPRTPAPPVVVTLPPPIGETFAPPVVVTLPPPAEKKEEEPSTPPEVEDAPPPPVEQQVRTEPFTKMEMLRARIIMRIARVRIEAELKQAREQMEKQIKGIMEKMGLGYPSDEIPIIFTEEGEGQPK